MPRGLEPSTLIWAVGWDALLGDIPGDVDTVGLTTRAADALEARAPQNSYLARSIYALGAAIALPYAAWLSSKWILGVAGLIHRAVYRETATALLKGAISIRGVLNGLHEVQHDAEDTEADTMPAAERQRQRSHALRRLSAELRDGIIGPLFYFSLFGIPGAVAFRVVKTLSARWSAHEGDPLALAAQRVDAAVTIAPSVASSLLIAAGAQVTTHRGQEAFDTSRAEARASGHVIDGRWTEAAMAGALDVTLDAEPDATGWDQSTNPDGRYIESADIENARRLFWLATAWAIVAALAAVTLRSGLSRRTRG